MSIPAIMSEVCNSSLGAITRGSRGLLSESLSAAFAKNLGDLLEARGISQRSLAIDVGVSPPTVTKWLSGKQTPTLHHVQMVANRLRVPAAALLAANMAIPAAVIMSPEEALKVLTEEIRRKLNTGKD